VDYWGIGMLAVGIGALQLLLDKGQEEDWFSSHLMVVLAVVAALALVVFVVYEWMSDDPIVDLHVFRNRTYSTGVFLMTVLGFVLYGSLVLLPIMLQTLLGYPSLEAGIAMAPRGIGSFIGMPVMGLLIGRFDPRRMVAVGLLVGGATLLWLGALDLNAGYWDFFWPQFVQGLGLSMLFVPLTTISMDSIPRERMGNATSLFNLMRNIGGSIGIAVTGTMLARQQQVHINVLGAHVDPYNPAAQTMIESLRAAFIAQGADAFTASQRAYGAVFGMVQRQAAMVTFVDIFRLLGFLFLLLIPLTLLMKRPSGKGPMGAGH
jgi:DHA2 family multidrug resistance protein